MRDTTHPADCGLCAADLPACTVPGLHGMTRDRAAAATRQMRAQGLIR